MIFPIHDFPHIYFPLWTNHIMDCSSMFIGFSIINEPFWGSPKACWTCWRCLRSSNSQSATWGPTWRRRRLGSAGFKDGSVHSHGGTHTWMVYKGNFNWNGLLGDIPYFRKLPQDIQQWDQEFWGYDCIYMRVYTGDGGSFSIGPFQTCRKTIQPKMGISIFGNLHMWWFPKIWAPSYYPFKII